MDKVSLTALGRQHLTAAHDAHREAAMVNDFMTDNDDPGDHIDSTDL